MQAVTPLPMDLKLQSDPNNASGD